MRPGVEILAAGVAGGGVGALGGYVSARLRGTDAAAAGILLGTACFIVAAFVVG